MPSDVHDSSIEESCVLMAQVPDGQTATQAESQLQLLRCLEGVHMAEVLHGASSGGAQVSRLRQPMALYSSRFGEHQAVLAVLLSSHALVDVLSSMLQIGCRDFVKTQHSGS